MNSVLKAAFDAEIAQARVFLERGELDAAYRHLERAHVLGQMHVMHHVLTHWLMLRVDARRRRPVAVFGQMVRLVLGALGSAVGIVPVGNTGGSDINMFKRMPIAPELQQLIDGHDTTSSPPPR